MLGEALDVWGCMCAAGAVLSCALPVGAEGAGVREIRPAFRQPGGFIQSVASPPFLSCPLGGTGGEGWEPLSIALLVA